MIFTGAVTPNATLTHSSSLEFAHEKTCTPGSSEFQNDRSSEYPPNDLYVAINSIHVLSGHLIFFKRCRCREDAIYKITEKSNLRMCSCFVILQAVEFNSAAPVSLGDRNLENTKLTADTKATVSLLVSLNYLKHYYFTATEIY